jgi:hypothetical protein
VNGHALAFVRRLAAIVWVLAAAGCSLLGGTEVEPGALRNLPVVDETVAFDPSQAVDDDDEREPPWEVADDEADAQPPPPPPEAAPGPVKPLPDDEHVASGDEVAALRDERRQQLTELARRDGDDEAKLELARNPPPGPLGQSKSTVWTITDYSLEGVLLLVAATVVAGAWTLARSFPKTIGASVLVAGLAITALLMTQGE